MYMGTFEEDKIEARGAHEELQRQLRMLQAAIERAENAGLSCVLQINISKGIEPTSTRILLSRDVRFSIAESRLIRAHDFAREG